MKLQYDEPVSNVALKFKLRRYIWGESLADYTQYKLSTRDGQVSAKVGRCRLTVSKPMLKAPGIKCFNLKYNKLLSTFGFDFNLRRYTQESLEAAVRLLQNRTRGASRGSALDAKTVMSNLLIELCRIMENEIRDVRAMGGYPVQQFAAAMSAITEAIVAGPGGNCSPRHPTHCAPSSLEFICTQ